MKRCLSIFGFLMVFRCLTAVEVGFSEVDYAINENVGSLRVVLIVTGQRGEKPGVTLEVVPMTISEYQNMTGTFPPGVSVDTDPAESDLDFNSTSQYVYINQGQGEISVYIDIHDDAISELDETFALHLRDVTDGTGEEGSEVPAVKIGRDVSSVHISQSASKRANIRLSESILTVAEGQAEMDQLFIELDGPIELAVTVLLNVQYTSITTAEDLYVATEVIIPANSISRVPVPIHVTDDLIAEEETQECITVILGLPTQPVYKIDWTNHGGDAYICIQDNDVPKLGIRRRGNESAEVDGGLIELMEGETEELCVVLLEPDACTMYIGGTVSLSPNTPTGVVLFEEQTLDFTTNQHCFEVTAIDNSVINAPVTVQFDINTQIFLGFHLQSGQGHVLVKPGLLNIRDDDGIPVPPNQVDLQVIGTGSVRISWIAQPSELQPVDKFVVVVQATPTRGIIRSRRQVQVPSLSPGEFWEQETSRTNLLLKIADTSKSYEISVCAENSLGRMCSAPQTITRNQLLNPTTLPPPKAEGLADLEKSASSEVLPFPLVIAIAVVVPVILLILCTTVIGVVIMCKYCSTGKEYSPSRQEKAVLGTVAFLEEAKYTKRDSYTSSVSMEWTGAEPYRRPQTFTPSRPPSGTSTVLGTPV